MKPLLSVHNLSFAYGTNRVFQNINFALHAGESAALVGANGSGKTTLLKLCACLLKPHGGEVLFEGKLLSQYQRKSLARNIALVPQEVHLSFDFTVRQFVEQGRTPHVSSFFGGFRNEDRRAVWNAMECAQVDHLADRNFNELSGGERQRAKIALAIAQEPRLLLLDEPTQHLDIGRQTEIFAVLRRLNQAGITIVAAVHDLHNAFAHFSSGMLVRPDSSLICGSIAEVLTPNAIQEVFRVTLPGVGMNLDLTAQSRCLRATECQ
jgi:iron complex transport system ATP-binding protein